MGRRIPTVTQRRVAQLGQVCYRRYIKVTKCDKKRREDPTFLEREQLWFSKLFDIARCKCEDPCQCRCAIADRVPPEEVEFLQDQRTKREFGLGPVDQVETRRRERRRKRMERESIEQNISAHSQGSTEVRNSPFQTLFDNTA